MIPVAVGIISFTILLLASMSNNRDIHLPKWRRVLHIIIVTAISALLSGITLLTLIIIGVVAAHPILLALPLAVVTLAAAGTIATAVHLRRKSKGWWDNAMAVIASDRTPVPARVTVQQINPYVGLYPRWEVRRRPDRTLAAVPLIMDKNKALQPRWEAADPTVFTDENEAWNHAFELTRMHTQMKAISASE